MSRTAAIITLGTMLIAALAATAAVLAADAGLPLWGVILVPVLLGVTWLGISRAVGPDEHA